MAEDPRLRVLPDIHGHAKGEHKPFAEERPIPYSARLIFLWFYHAARRGAPRYMMVTDHVNYLTFEDPAAVNLVRRALRLAGAGDVLGAAEAAGVDIAQAQVVSDALRGGMRFTIGAEVDNDPRSRPDAPNVVDAMRPDGIIRSIHFLPIAHSQYGEDFFWPFDNPEFAHLFEHVGVGETWDRYIDLLVDAVATQPTHIVGHLHVPGKFGHWCEPAKLEEYENRVLDLCSERDIAIELNARVFYRSNDEAHKARHIEIYRRMLHKAKERDVGIALGSDAHSPRDQGRGFDILLRLLDETETNEIVFPIAGKHARVALRPDQVKPRPRVLAAAAAAAAAAKAEAEAAAIAKAEAEAAAATASTSVGFERTTSVQTVEAVAATDTTPAEIVTTTMTVTESVAVAIAIATPNITVPVQNDVIDARNSETAVAEISAAVPQVGDAVDTSADALAATGKVAQANNDVVTGAEPVAVNQSAANPEILNAANEITAADGPLDEVIVADQTSSDAHLIEGDTVAPDYFVAEFAADPAIANAEPAAANAETAMSEIADPMIGDLVTAVPESDVQIVEVSAIMAAATESIRMVTDALDGARASAQAGGSAVGHAETGENAGNTVLSVNASDTPTTDEDLQIAAKRRSAKDRRKEGDEPLPVITGETPAARNSAAPTVHAAKPKSRPHGAKAASNAADQQAASSSTAAAKKSTGKTGAVKAAVAKSGGKVSGEKAATVKGKSEKPSAVKAAAKAPAKSAAVGKAATTARSSKSVKPAVTSAKAAAKPTAAKTSKSSSVQAAPTKPAAAKATAAKSSPAKSVHAKAAAPKSAAAKSSGSKSTGAKAVKKSSGTTAAKSTGSAKSARKTTAGAKAR